MLQGMHKVLYDDGDEDLLDLSDHDWVLDGPDTDLVDTSRLMRLRDDLNALDDEDDELFGNVSISCFPLHILEELTFPSKIIVTCHL